MTPQQATKQLLDMGCNYFSVVDIDGNTLVPKQQNKFTEPADIKKQAEKVANYVKTAPEGTYVIEGRIGSTSKPTQLVVHKGESAPATAEALKAAAPSRGISDPGSESVLSYSAALKMQQQIAELTAENARLKDLVESLEADLADMEADAADAPQLAESPAMGAIGQLAAVLPALVDKWFENQKENREIEKAKLYQQHQQRQAQQAPRSYENNTTSYDTF
jgi:dihydrodipicolinate synthase/N-acetylneuraminate lyase